MLDGADSAARFRNPPDLRTLHWMKRAWSRKNLWENSPRWVRTAAGAVLRAIPQERLLGAGFREALRFVREAQNWPAARAEAYQVAQLRAICTLARDRTPFYRRVFDAAGVDPARVTPETLQRLPTIDRGTLREHLDEMCAVPPHAPGVDLVTTGGTSGEPLRFYIGSGRSGPEYAYLVVGWERVGYRLHLPQAVLRGRVVAPDRHGLRHEYDPVLRRHYYSNFHADDQSLARYLDHIATLGPCYLHVYPSSVTALARHLQRSGRPAPANIRGILAGSEIVYPEQRELAQRVLGVRYYSWYGHSEKLVMAAECEQATDYHVFPTYGHCELLDESGQRVTHVGQTGEIVATGFLNTVVPFIRYRTGDLATYAGEKCAACGREQMLLRDIRGHRTQEVLVAADGTAISWTALNMHDDTFDRVRQFQFVQHRPGEATLRLVALDGFCAADEERIRRRLNAKLEDRLAFDVERVAEIELTRSGKCTYVDQRIDAAHLHPRGTTQDEVRTR